MLVGCSSNNSKTTIKHILVAPNDSDIQTCSYPVLQEYTDSALADVYIQSLAQIKLCNERLRAVQKLKQEYKRLYTD